MEDLPLSKLKLLPEYRLLPPSVKKSTLSAPELRLAIQRYRLHKDKFTCSDHYDFTSEELMNTLKQTLADYYMHGPRSSKKLDVLHFFIRCLVLHILRETAPDLMPNIKIFSQPFREAQVSGMLYKKYVDITVSYKRRHVGLISVKFITSNYGQNANNYFENVLGDSINLKGAIGKPRIFWFSLFSFENIPYYKKDNSIDKYEILKADNYRLLWDYSLRYTTLPDCISLTILNNTKKMTHPNKVDMDEEHMREFIQELLPGGYKEDVPLQFFPQLRSFCSKVIKLIRDNYTEEGKKRISGVRSNSL